MCFSFLFFLDGVGPVDGGVSGRGDGAAAAHPLLLHAAHPAGVLGSVESSPVSGGDAADGVDGSRWGRARVERVLARVDLPVLDVLEQGVEDWIKVSNFLVGRWIGSRRGMDGLLTCGEDAAEEGADPVLYRVERIAV